LRSCPDLPPPLAGLASGVTQKHQIPVWDS
jgi:hypothetical protein